MFTNHIVSDNHVSITVKLRKPILQQSIRIFTPPLALQIQKFTVLTYV